MRLRLMVLLALVACAGTPHAQPENPRMESRAQPAPTPPALRDGAEEAIASRARIGRLGAIRYERAGAAIEADLGTPGEASDAVRLVAAVTDARAQIRVDGDDARLLLWLDRADLRPVVVKAQALIGARGAVVRPGASVSILTADGDQRDIAVDDGGVRVRGRVPAAVIGDVFERRVRRTTEHTGTVSSDTKIYATPEAGGVVIAVTTGPIDVRALAPASNGWLEVEIDREWLYVRGHVPSADVVPDAGDVYATYGATSGYGMSDTDSLILPSGACLYARPGGPIVGVNTAERQRYAIGEAAPGWRRIAVSTEWGLIWPAVHFPELAGKAAGDFDRCPLRFP